MSAESTKPPSDQATTVSLRAPMAGDMGWVIARHGAVYAAEYGYDMHFEALVARIAADFVDRFDPAREACWIATKGRRERDDPRVGCVFVVQARDEASGQIEAGVAQLRLLLVEPHARGMALGQRMVAQCTEFARAAGYQRLRLWTQSELLAARALYVREGYQRVGTESHHSFGKDLIGEVWELPLWR